MSRRRFLRHNILGSEVGRPRPLVYLRAERGRRPGLAARWSAVGLAAIAVAVAAIAFSAWIAAVQ